MTKLSGSSQRTRAAGASLILLALCVALAVMLVQPAHAAGRDEASRYQDVTSGQTDVPDLTRAHADWPFDVQAETCVGDDSDYKIVVRGPYITEGGTPHATLKAELAMWVRRANIGSGTYNAIFTRCKYCPTNKMQSYNLKLWIG